MVTMPSDDDGSSDETETPRYRSVLKLARGQARLHGHSYVGVEHLLLAILEDGHSVASAAIEKVTELETLRAEIEAILASDGYRGTSAPPR